MATSVFSLIDPTTNPYMDEEGAASSGIYNALFGTVSPWQANAIGTQVGSDVQTAGGGPEEVDAAYNEVGNFLSTFYPEQSPLAAIKQGITGDPSGQTSLSQALINALTGNSTGNTSQLIVWSALILFVIVLVATFAGSRR